MPSAKVHHFSEAVALGPEIANTATLVCAKIVYTEAVPTAHAALSTGEALSASTLSTTSP